MKRKIFEAKLNLPQEYIQKVRGEAKKEYGVSGPTLGDKRKMGELIHKIMNIQRGYEDELTELGIQIIKHFYGALIEDVKLDVKIVSPDDEEKMEMAQKMIADPEEEEQEEEIDDDLLDLGIEPDIDKRKLINNIMQGEAQNVHDMILYAKKEIEEITGSKDLPDLYLTFLKLNRKFDWDESIDLSDMMKNMPQMANTMETEWDEENDEPKIKARVMDLVMIIHETIKGIYELIASGAIDADPVRAKKILKATDTLADEQEDIRYGPYVARDIRNYINKVIEDIPGARDIPNIREFVFGKLINLQAKQFVEVVNKILLNKKEPASIIEQAVKEIQDEFGEYRKQEVERKLDDVGYEEEEEYVETEDYPIEDPAMKMPEPKEKKLAGMGKKELNYQLNVAIDNEDWEKAKEIQQMMERKGFLKEHYIIKKIVSESLSSYLKRNK